MATFLDYCVAAGADRAAVTRIDESRDKLTRRWYASLDAGQPDYSIYDTDEYLAEAWFCWSTYSARYLKLISRSDYFRRLRPRTVVDLGCGIGWSTGLLSKLYPDAAVVGTNRLDSAQTRVAQAMARREGLNFRIVEQLGDIGHADLVFASEYFEHFPAPIDHFHDVQAALTPAVLLIASTFNQPSPGHFPNYQLNDQLAAGSAVGRRFNTHLRSAGYRRLPIKFWNDRPSCWEATHG